MRVAFAPVYKPKDRHNDDDESGYCDKLDAGVSPAALDKHGASAHAKNKGWVNVLGDKWICPDCIKRIK